MPKVDPTSFVYDHAKTVLRFLGSKSQAGMVLQHLIQKGTITQVEAHELYRVYRLASRMSDLKNWGVAFQAIKQVDLTGRRYVQYKLG